MSDRFNDDGPEFSGYTDEQGDPIHQALIDVHLKPGATAFKRVTADPSELLGNRILVWREIRDGDKRYFIEGEAAVGKLFNGLVHIERSGVPNGNFRKVLA
jgi:hypothetical protein